MVACLFINIVKNFKLGLRAYVVKYIIFIIIIRFNNIIIFIDMF